MTMSSRMNPAFEKVTRRIVRRSQETRAAYLEHIHGANAGGPNRLALSCSNLAHGMAVCGQADKNRLAGKTVPNVGIVSAYNDMLSAHQPFETYPDRVREAAKKTGALAQAASSHATETSVIVYQSNKGVMRP